MKRAAKVVVFNIGATLVILLVLEGASRLIQPVDFPEPLIIERRENWSKTMQYDPYLFWAMRPNIFDSTFGHTNSLRLRGPEIAPKDPQTFRILSLGESTTWGAFVRYEETYSSLLEKELPAVEGRRVQVINAGVSGYTLFQGLTYLRLHGLALKPDAVLIYFGFNDFLRVTFRAMRDADPQPENAGLTDREFFEVRTTRRSRLLYALQKNSNLARLVLLHAVSAKDDVVLASKLARVPEADRRWIYLELREMARKHGFRLVVIIPWYQSFDKHVPLLRELTAWDDVTVVDLPAQLTVLPQPRARFFVDTAHPNQEGHRLIAQEIGAHLRSVWSSGEADDGE